MLGRKTGQEELLADIQTLQEPVRLLKACGMPCRQRHFHQHDPEAGWEELLAKLGSSCASLVQAAIEAATDLQEALLQSHALDVSLGRVFGYPNMPALVSPCEHLLCAWDFEQAYMSLLSTPRGISGSIKRKPMYFRNTGLLTPRLYRNKVVFLRAK